MYVLFSKCTHDVNRAGPITFLNMQRAALGALIGKMCRTGIAIGSNSSSIIQKEGGVFCSYKVFNKHEEYYNFKRQSLSTAK
jgi:hypothetical protein